MSSEAFALRVRNVSKHYLMFDRPQDRLKQSIMPRIQRLFGRPPAQYYRDFAALNGISFDVKRGETVGIIGRNGCGKSTLLQIACGTLQPTSGTVEVNGRIAALLELGAGFNPEFTGRENVYMNGAILGLSREELEERFESIIAFADIGHFLDQPVKTYSSGMYVRLAFATAINVDPDILVVDEALSVGDEAFQRKCFARIEDIKDKGGTILFVSHGAQTIVQLCDRAMLIDRGELILEGRPKTVVNQYQRFVNLSGVDAEPVREKIKAMDGWAQPAAPAHFGGKDGALTPPANAPGRDEVSAAPSVGETDDESWFDPTLVSHSRVEYESKGARISNVRIETPDGRQVNVLQSGLRYVYCYTVCFDTRVSDVGFGMLVKTTGGVALGGAATDFAKRFKLPEAAAGSVYEVQFDLRWALTPGTYFLNAGVTGSIDGNTGYSHRLLDALAIRIQPKTEQIATTYIDFDPVPKYALVAKREAASVAE